MAYEDGRVMLKRILCMDAEKGTKELVTSSLPLDGDGFYTVWLRVNVRKGGMCRFSYSLDSRKFVVLGDDFKMKEGRWIGAKAGFFATAKIRKNDGGSVDIQ